MVGGGGRLGVVEDCFEVHQRCPGVDLAVRGDQHLADPARDRGGDGRFDLHALDHRHRRAGFDQVADGHPHSDDHARRRGPYHPAVVVGDAVRYAAHFDQCFRPLPDRHHPEAATCDGQPTLEPAEPFDVYVDAAPVDHDPVPARADLGHRHAVGGAGVAQIHDWPTSGLASGRPRAAAVSEAVPIDLGQVVVGVDGRCHQRHVGSFRNTGTGRPR